MANSGIVWVDAIFNFCVILLVDTARWLGISYEEINIWLFIIIHPLITLLFLVLWLKERFVRW